MSNKQETVSDERDGTTASSPLHSTSPERSAARSEHQSDSAAEALRELIAARDVWDTALGSGTQKARERAERRVLRAWESAKAVVASLPDSAGAGRDSVLEARVRELEAIAGHYHVATGDGTDRCAKCGLDLRDNIHHRVTERSIAPGRSLKQEGGGEET